MTCCFRPARHTNSLGQIFWGEFNKNLSYIAVAAGLMAASKGFSVLIPLLMKRIVDAISAGQTWEISVFWLVGVYAILRLLNVSFGELRELTFGQVIDAVYCCFAAEILSHVHTLDYEFHVSKTTGALDHDIERGLSGLRNAMRQCAFNIVPTVFELALVSGVLLYTYPVSVSAIMVSFAIIYGWSTIKIGRWQANTYGRFAQAERAFSSTISESLNIFEWLKLSDGYGLIARALKRDLGDIIGQNQAIRWQSFIANDVQAILIMAAVVAEMLLLLKMTHDGSATVGDFVAVLGFLMQILGPIGATGYILQEFRRSLTNIGCLREILGISAKIRDVSSPRRLSSESVPEVRFKEVSFVYSSGLKAVDSLTLTIAPGTCIGVVGATGSGKTTLGRLLLRLVDPTAGAITLDEVNLREFLTADLRNILSAVPQEPILLNGSIRENILAGLMEQPSEARLWSGLRAAQLEPLIARLPSGLEARVGDRGLQLSGGERQRIAICRAVLRSPRILLLDEATSFLDPETAAAVRLGLRGLLPNSTLIVISHRLADVVDAEQVAVLSKGRLVESGNHAQLLRGQGAYHRLWSTENHLDAAGA